MDNRFEPYVGPRPFERTDQSIFFGRNREANDLLSLIIAHPVVLLYAQSGAGKTSLLNAKLIPMLEEKRFEVLPIARVQGLAPEDVSPSSIENVFVMNALMNWSQERPNIQALGQLSLEDYLRRRGRPLDEERAPVPRAVIFDQFEELFTAYPERWQDREPFFKQVYDALQDDPLLRVVFVIREDYIAQVDPCAPLLPERLRTRFRLERLRQSAALEAITSPLDKTAYSFDEGVAEKLVEDLLKVRVEMMSGKTQEVMGEFVEPVQLQIVCRSLWQHAKRRDIFTIGEEQLQVFGDVDQALSEFYQACLLKATRHHNIPEQKMREWFDKKLITPAETRGIVYRGERDTGGIPNVVVDLLESHHLIRGEWRAGARWYELTHDRFINPIRRSNREWSIAGSFDTRRIVELDVLPEMSRLIIETQKFELRITEKEAQHINQRFTQVLEELSEEVERRGVDFRQYDHDYLERLYELGKRATSRLLPPTAQIYLRKLEKEAQKRKLGLTLQTPIQLSLLWEMLCIESSCPRAWAIEPSVFWGFRYPLGRTYWEIEASDRIKARLDGFAFISDDDECSKRISRQFWQEFSETASPLRSYHTERKVADSSALWRLLLSRSDLSERYSKDPGSSSDFFNLLCMNKAAEKEKLKELVTILTRQFHQTRGELAERPLVFLNSCKTFTSASPQYTIKTPTRLLVSGAGGVIAAACAMPDNFTTQFTQELYRRMLEKLLRSRSASIAELLLETRLYFLREYNNPLGLAYGLHAASDQKVELEE